MRDVFKLATADVLVPQVDASSTERIFDWSGDGMYAGQAGRRRTVCVGWRAQAPGERDGAAARCTVAVAGVGLFIRSANNQQRSP